MYAKTKMNWLKALALVAFSQFCFLVGTAQAHAEETTAIQPTMEAIAQVASEVTEVQPAEATWAMASIVGCIAVVSSACA
ncbi:hypothetical protein HQ789_05650 [Enterococcus faecium]|nr:hypothetical protein [Enterococcus faecium]